MKQGMTLAELSTVLDFNDEHKRDFLISTEQMWFVTEKDGTYSLEFNDTSTGKDRTFEYDLTTHALRQIANFSMVPWSLVTFISGHGSHEEKTVLARLLTLRLNETPATKLIRTITSANDNHIRAFLSDRYRVLDNGPLMQAIFPILKRYKGKLKVESCNITETHLYVKLSYPGLNGSLGTTHDAFGAKVDDIVEAGVMITNSEVGDGPVKVQPFIKRLICKNGATVTIKETGHRKTHLGRKLTKVNVTNVDEYFERVAESVETMLADKKFFKTLIKKFKDTKQMKITGDVPAVIKALTYRYNFTVEEGESITSWLGSSRTLFGLVNAVTRTAQHPLINYDRATELEAIGGRMINMTPATWKLIGSAITPEVTI
jgi:uncharacterized protein DUF932